MSITKGKWEAVENDHFIDIKVDGNPIAQVIVNQYANVDKEQMRANARMMALAPEMRDYLSHMVKHEMIDDHSVEREIQSLLAKVKGDL